MACDIHAYIEYRPPLLDSGVQPSWTAFGEELYLDQDYTLFGHLAGVRRDTQPVVAPRGVPDDMDVDISRFYWMEVTDAFSDESTMSTAGAGYWASKGVQPVHRYGRTFLPGGDWHTASWLTTAEFEEALRRAGRVSETIRGRDDYHAVLAAMRSFEASGNACRLVFWFDN